ncbi:MAG: tlde1 domain-containing protein, partial [bacterium]
MPDPDRYKVERYDSTLVKSSLSLQFDGTNLTLVGAGPTAKVYPAVSGRPDKKGKFDYSAARQREQNAGPIPAGTYWVRPDEIWSNAWYKVGSRSAWGNFRLTIHPFTTTQTPGRKGGFFIHGGSVAG